MKEISETGNRKPDSETVSQYLARIIPHGPKCDGCPKGDPHGLAGYSGPIFCHLLEEVMPHGEKECAINDDRWEDAPLGHTPLSGIRYPVSAIE